MAEDDDTTAPVTALVKVEAPLPGRYTVVARDEVAWVQSTSAPNLRLHVAPGLTLEGNERKRHPAQTIFLDGVYRGAPFLDNEARQYSLDHHEGCVRQFTVATCEQAAIVVLAGLPLEEGEWHLWINEPDLDAVLAAWVLLNHAELLRDDRALLRQVMPFIRLEGVIDGHGLDLQLLAALGPEAEAEWVPRLQQLVAHDRGRRGEADLLEFTRTQLERLDETLLPAGHLDHLREVQELDRIDLGSGQAAILCRSDLGIYEVEQHLTERHEGHVGLIVLDFGGGRYTLRQPAAFLARDLTHLYPVLNRRDPRVGSARAADRWGGSAQIGGSPRGSGSGLSGPEILALVKKAYRRRRFWDWLRGR